MKEDRDRDRNFSSIPLFSLEPDLFQSVIFFFEWVVILIVAGLNLGSINKTDFRASDVNPT